MNLVQIRSFPDHPSRTLDTPSKTGPERWSTSTVVRKLSQTRLLNQGWGSGVTIWGYARVSTAQQDLGPQLAALLEAGVDEANVVTDTISGSRVGRPGLDRLLVQLQHGDILTVWKLDRLGRSVSHLVGLVEEMGERGIQFRSLTDGLDTTTTSGRFMFNVVAAMAQFERDLNQERTAAALAALHEKGVSLGRPSRITRGQYDVIHNLREQGESERAIASSVGLSRSTVRRVIQGEIASMVKFQLRDSDTGVLVPTDVRSPR